MHSENGASCSRPPLSLRTPVAIGGHLELAERVALDTEFLFRLHTDTPSASGAAYEAKEAGVAHHEEGRGGEEPLRRGPASVELNSVRGASPVQARRGEGRRIVT